MTLQPEFVKMFVEEVKEELLLHGGTPTELSITTGIKYAALRNFIIGQGNLSDIQKEKVAKALEMKCVLCLMEDES